MNRLKIESLSKHRKLKGKVAVVPKEKISSVEDLSLVYSPGVAYACLEIENDRQKAYEYTIKSNTILVVTDGSAVLGLGNIGPHAALPVMEGKCLLFKQFGNINAFPLCLDTQDEHEIVRICQMVAPTVGGINLEDISAPRCITIEKALKETLDIPVFHDDQHGTSIVVGAAILNLQRLYKLDFNKMKVVICGTGAAGHSIIRLLNKLGLTNLFAYNKKGVVCTDTREHHDETIQSLIDEKLIKNPEKGQNTLKDLLEDADLFIGVSSADLLTAADIGLMRHKIIFALANPKPELSYEEAQKADVLVYATGRSDYPNQINNLLAFPGIFKGTLAARASKISEQMIMSAVLALSQVVTDEELKADYLIPSPFDRRVIKAVSMAVKKQALKERN